jgi:hypothetical protein
MTIYRITEQRTVLASFLVEADTPEQAEELFLESSDKIKADDEEILHSHGLTVQPL